jgi:peptidoglycan/xylan/chitin deacetylase (PgdA/CDA1 family)
MNEFERAACFSKIKKQLNVSSEPSDHVMLGWNEIQELQKEGFVSFGSHTHSHVDLAVLNPTMAELEISQSKQEIENFLGIPCTLFSYPFGKRHNFNQGIKKNLRNMGFSIAVTTIRGSISKGSDPFELRRIAAIDDSSYRFKCSLIGVALQRR